MQRTTGPRLEYCVMGFLVGTVNRIILNVRTSE